MKNVWVQIRNGRHPGFEEGELSPSLQSQVAHDPSRSLATDRTEFGIQA